MVCLGFSLKGNALGEEAWERGMPGLKEQDAVTSRSCRGGRTAVRLNLDLWQIEGGKE